MTKYVRDGIVYEEWPSDHEHILNLSAAYDSALKMVAEEMKHRLRLEKELERVRRQVRAN